MNDDILFTRDEIPKYKSNSKIIKYVKNYFCRLSRGGSISLIDKILKGYTDIHCNTINKSKTFFKSNSKFFDDDKKLKIEIIEEIYKKLIIIIKNLKDSISIHSVDEKEINVEKKIIDGEECYLVNRYSSYENIRKLMCDEHNICFRYNFDKPDMKPIVPKNLDNLQMINIQITSKPIKFDFPLEYVYNCPKCGKTGESKKSYEVISTKNKWNCQGLLEYEDAKGETKSKLCNTVLYPDDEISHTKDCYFYDIIYTDKDGELKTTQAFAFNRYKPGYYKAVVFRIKNPKRNENYHIVDIEETESNKFELPEKKEDENYIYTLQRQVDNFITKQTGLNIYGLFPIKCALLVQKAASHFKEMLRYNIQIVGNASTGKSTVLKFYGFTLNNHLHLSSNGLNISIPALRGTRETINILGTNVNIVTQGYLGTYSTIHIDEAREDPELVQNLKTFLFDTNYSYNKAGSDGCFRKRTAHGNLSENLDYQHLSLYRMSIKKEYKNLEVDDLEEWDETWDLHLPVFKYENKYLRKIIKDKRMEYQQRQMWWIDGYDYALHQRFPFYFYLVKEKNDKNFDNVIKENTSKTIIEENMEVMKVLKNQELDLFFDSLSEYIESEYDLEGFNKVDDILDIYGLKLDSRQKEFYYKILKISRIINKRKTIEDMDYDFVKYIIEKTNCKLDIIDTADYHIEGVQNKIYDDEVEDEIEKNKSLNEDFGIPKGEFD